MSIDSSTLIASAYSRATFKVIFNEVPIQQFYSLPYDRWEGYENEREKPRHDISDNVDNAIFMTTDVHANLVNDARYNTLGGPGVENSGILDVTNGPVATENYSGEINGATGNPLAGNLIQTAFLKPPPPAGVGMTCAATDQFSYAEATVTKKQLKIDLLDDQDQPVLDTGDVEAHPDAPACDPVVLKAKRRQRRPSARAGRKRTTGTAVVVPLAPRDNSPPRPGSARALSAALD